MFCTFQLQTWIISVTICCIPFCVATWFIPESPVYLMLRGKSEQAAVVMDKLGRDEDNFLQLKQHTSCKKQTEVDDDTGVCSSIHTTIQRVSNSSVIKPFVTGIALMTFFQVKSFGASVFELNLNITPPA